MGRIKNLPALPTAVVAADSFFAVDQKVNGVYQTFKCTASQILGALYTGAVIFNTVIGQRTYTSADTFLSGNLSEMADAEVVTVLMDAGPISNDLVSWDGTSFVIDDDIDVSAVMRVVIFYKPNE